MEEIEVPLENAQENIHEEAHHARERWISHVALSSALVAVMAAIAALLAGQHSNEAMMDQIKSSNNWSYYQAKGVKSAVLNSKMQLLQSMGHPPSEKDQEKLVEYGNEQDEIKKEAEEHMADSERHLRVHETLAKSVTLFQVAIAVSAISVLMKRRRFWALSLVFGAVGLVFFILGLRL